MKKLSSLFPRYEGRIFVYLEDEKARKDFAHQAEQEGFAFCDGAKLSERNVQDIMAINRDFTVNFVGFIGRIAFQCADKVGKEKLHKINYKTI